MSDTEEPGVDAPRQRSNIEIIYRICGEEFTARFVKVMRKYKKAMKNAVNWKDMSVPVDDSKMDDLLEYQKTIFEDYNCTVSYAEVYTHEEIKDELKKIMERVLYIMSYVEVEKEIWLEAETSPNYYPPYLHRSEA